MAQESTEARAFADADTDGPSSFELDRKRGYEGRFWDATSVATFATASQPLGLGLIQVEPVQRVAAELREVTHSFVDGLAPNVEDGKPGRHATYPPNPDEPDRLVGGLLLDAVDDLDCIAAGRNPSAPERPA